MLPVSSLLLSAVVFRVTLSTSLNPSEVLSKSCRFCNWRTPCDEGYTCTNLLSGGYCQIIECETDSDCEEKRTPCRTVGCCSNGRPTNNDEMSRICHDSNTKSCEIACLQYDPVCGENGVTYSCGRTEAECNGVCVAYAGECNARFDAFKMNVCQVCSDESPCPMRGYLCEKAKPTDNEGICVYRECDSYSDCPTGQTCYKKGCCDNGISFLASKPSSMCVDNSLGVGCYDIWKPVCGFDGKTYGNDCEAISSGACIHYEGECRDKLNAPCSKKKGCNSNTKFEP